MNSLRELTTQLSFTVYTSLPRRTLPVSLLRQLCTAVSDHKLSSILACAKLSRLYGGHGAQLLEGDELSEPAPNPPAYDDVGPRPSNPIKTKDRKRRRRSSSESAYEHSSICRADVETLLADRLDAHKRGVDKSIAGHKSWVLQMLKDFKAELDGKHDAWEDRVIEDRLSDLVAAKVKEKMGEVEDRVMESITSRPLQASLTFTDHPIYY
ncbi:hypothetical protein F5883DRAFT_49270 [Diaporthe sp. PMI_573]|nr:hypothetical protein F5883DRAFT_49270 [Diaporthaceae sp. PMI_573]